MTGRWLLPVLLSIPFAAPRAQPTVRSAAQHPRPPPTPPPSDAECGPLPAPRLPPSFGPGEHLEYQLDAMGAIAGTLVMSVLPLQQGQLPVRVEVQTNTFFSKVRRVRGAATSFLNARTLRPVRYQEDTLENTTHRTAEVTFSGRDHAVRVAYTVNGSPGTNQFTFAHDGLDPASAIELLRQLPMKKGLPLCVDVYGIRRLWRVFGSVVGREHVSLPIGDFQAWHIQGEAVRLDDFASRRGVEMWITDDARRLPLVAVGTIDLGAVRATLIEFDRPHDKKKHARSDTEELSW